MAGRGHELYQEYKKTKYFSDKESIIKAIKKKIIISKNNHLRDNEKVWVYNTHTN